MAFTTTELLTRCCASPRDHLAKPTWSHFCAYLLGYASCCPIAGETFDYEAFTASVKEDYKVLSFESFNFNITSFIDAVEGEENALLKHLDYRIRLSTPTGKMQSRQGDLMEQLYANGLIRKRLGMYFGNDVSAAHLWSAFSGGRWAENDAGIEVGKYTTFSTDFQAWVEQRYSFSKGIPWFRTFYLISGNTTKYSVETFFNDFDAFNEGESPDCL